MEESVTFFASQFNIFNPFQSYQPVFNYSPSFFTSPLLPSFICYVLSFLTPSSLFHSFHHVSQFCHFSCLFFLSLSVIPFCSLPQGICHTFHSLFLPFNTHIPFHTLSLLSFLPIFHSITFLPLVTTILVRPISTVSSFSIRSFYLSHILSFITQCSSHILQSFFPFLIRFFSFLSAVSPHLSFFFSNTCRAPSSCFLLTLEVFPLLEGEGHAAH